MPQNSQRVHTWRKQLAMKIIDIVSYNVSAPAERWGFFVWSVDEKYTDVCKGRKSGGGKVCGHTLLKKKVTRASHKIAFVANSVQNW